MRPQTDPARRCLPVTDWPNADRAAWQAALSTDDLLSFARSTAASWRPATCHKNRRGYGRWLTFLRNSGEDWSVPLDDRVTRERVAAYLDELRRHQVSLYTIRNRIMELRAVMLALAPDRNWSWLKACVVHLGRRAEDAADRRLPPLLASDVLDRAMKELRRRAQAPSSCREAVAYRDWLMLTVLAVLPLRLRNFSALSLTRHMERRAGVWCIDIDGNETKTGRPYAARIPTNVGKYLDHYLSHIRPRLDQGAGGNNLWLSRSGSPVAEHTIYITITELTQRAFDTALNPHLFRHIFATSVSIADPEAIEGARAALGHATRRTTQHHYNRAAAFTAARTHAKIMQRLREKTSRDRGALGHADPPERHYNLAKSIEAVRDHPRIAWFPREDQASKRCR
jgi:site-specific recombinase XerD